VIGRGATRLLAAPRIGPDEAGLQADLDALGGEVIRLRSRDGLKLAGRWLPSEIGPVAGATPGVAGGDTAGGPRGIAGDRKADEDLSQPWQPDPYEAILLLHGWTGSVAPDLVALGPTLRRTSGVLGLDFRGHGGSDDGPTTFGLLEIEDVAGALVWFGDRGIRRVALVGSSMGGVVALASIVVLGDGSLAAADLDPDAPAASIGAPRPRIVGAVVESVAPDLRIPVANRIGAPVGGVIRRAIAARMFAEAGRRVGGDLRATEPIRVIGLVEPVPLLLIHGSADRTVRPADGRRLAAAAGPAAEHWEAPGADHGQARAADPAAWDERVSAFLRRAFVAGREAVAIIGRPVEPAVAPATGGQEGD
jgi:pimeloyl-ACP methyl ester carboxylesterase